MNECNSFLETSIVYGSSISDLNLYICLNKALSLCLIFIFDLYLYHESMEEGGSGGRQMGRSVRKEEEEEMKP